MHATGHAVSLWDIAVVVAIGAIVCALAACGDIGGARSNARKMVNSTQLRGVHQGMITYAQGNRSPIGTGFYPGMNGRGQVHEAIDWTQPPFAGPFSSPSTTGGVPAVRYAVMLNGAYFTPDYLINPLDSGTKQPATGAVTAANYSYAALRLDNGPRRGEWKETLNSSAVVLSDRNMGTVAAPQSPWTSSGKWEGSICYNDGSAAFLTSLIAENTTYGAGAIVPADNLFVPDDADQNGGTDANAAMVFATESDHEMQK